MCLEAALDVSSAYSAYSVPLEVALDTARTRGRAYRWCAWARTHTGQDTLVGHARLETRIGQGERAGGKGIPGNRN